MFFQIIRTFDTEGSIFVAVCLFASAEVHCSCWGFQTDFFFCRRFFKAKPDLWVCECDNLCSWLGAKDCAKHVRRRVCNNANMFSQLSTSHVSGNLLPQWLNFKLFLVGFPTKMTKTKQFKLFLLGKLTK